MCRFRESSLTGATITRTEAVGDDRREGIDSVPVPIVSGFVGDEHQRVGTTTGVAHRVLERLEGVFDATSRIEYDFAGSAEFSNVAVGVEKYPHDVATVVVDCVRVPLGDSDHVVAHRSCVVDHECEPISGRACDGLLYHGWRVGARNLQHVSWEDQILVRPVVSVVAPDCLPGRVVPDFGTEAPAKTIVLGGEELLVCHDDQVQGGVVARRDIVQDVAPNDLVELVLLGVDVGSRVTLTSDEEHDDAEDAKDT